ncbi:E3 ubiquitin-protein ligase TRIM47-like [Erpetoichthys calabaricus]|uniref:E3 ubiquitin-protein ligase TRIM47-like n=1 Tax=Erpetoichthys calabaricus TaxID=27687 RepID=UPI002234005A|nr:E3 ubiquitin-protein ligase TRIM47-like [Erpetoichthys calabaricus]
MSDVKSPESLDQFTCSVCLETLSNPVTTPCGHNYCMSCIELCWDKTGECRCPQCRQVFAPRPALHKNTLLAQVIENSKQEESSDPQICGVPGDVKCDVCNGRKRKAVQTCLTCLASYCETHIRHHRESEALKKHKLDEPTGNLKQRLCVEHNTAVELYCRTDQKCVCLLCAAVRHKEHELVELETERGEKQSQVGESLRKVRARICEKKSKVTEMKETVVQLKSFAEREEQKNDETFVSLLQSIERLRSEVTEVIRDHEQREVMKAEKVIKQLEEEIEELVRRDTELVELSEKDDHIHFLQKFQPVIVHPEDDVEPNFTVNRNLLPETLWGELSELKKNLEESSGWEFLKSKGDEDPVYFLQNLTKRNHLLKYSYPLTLDPNTLNEGLHLTETNRTVASGGQFSYPDHPDRFDCWLQLLGSEALFNTRCYWEVEWSGDCIFIGVAYAGICRKGWSVDCLIGRNDRSWSVCCTHSSYSAWHNNKMTEIREQRSPRIGVFLDYPAGSLSFFSISDTMTLLHRFKATFTQPLYPAFYVLGRVSISPLNLSNR